MTKKYSERGERDPCGPLRFFPIAAGTGGEPRAEGERVSKECAKG